MLTRMMAIILIVVLAVPTMTGTRVGSPAFRLPVPERGAIPAPVAALARALMATGAAACPPAGNCDLAAAPDLTSTPTATATPTPTDTPQPTPILSLAPANGAPGDVITASGELWTPSHGQTGSDWVWLFWGSTSNALGSAPARADGAFVMTFTVPADATPGPVTIIALQRIPCQAPCNSVLQAQAPFTVRPPGPTATPTATSTPPPALALTPASGQAGGAIVVSGSHWLHGHAAGGSGTVTLVWKATRESLGSARVQADGAFSVPVVIPADASPGVGQVAASERVQCQPACGTIIRAVATFTVLAPPPTVTPTASDTPTPTITPTPTDTPTPTSTFTATNTPTATARLPHTATPTAGHCHGAAITATPSTVAPGGTLDVTGWCFPARTKGVLELNNVSIASIRANAQGRWEVLAAIPANAPCGLQPVTALMPPSAHAYVLVNIVCPPTATPTATPSNTPLPSPTPTVTPTPGQCSPPQINAYVKQGMRDLTVIVNGACFPPATAVAITVNGTVDGGAATTTDGTGHFITTLSSAARLICNQQNVIVATAGGVSAQDSFALVCAQAPGPVAGMEGAAPPG